jgi:F0F1-type ATP synthase assembly protein I
MERQQKANSFGKGLAIDGIAGVIIGVLIGR